MRSSMLVVVLLVAACARPRPAGNPSRPRALSSASPCRRPRRSVDSATARTSAGPRIPRPPRRPAVRAERRAQPGEAGREPDRRRCETSDHRLGGRLGPHRPAEDGRGGRHPGDRLRQAPPRQPRRRLLRDVRELPRRRPPGRVAADRSGPARRRRQQHGVLLQRSHVSPRAVHRRRQAGGAQWTDGLPGRHDPPRGRRDRPQTHGGDRHHVIPAREGGRPTTTTTASRSWRRSP